MAAIAAVAPESAGTIDFAEPALPFPDDVDSGSFAELVPGFVETPLGDGVEATVDRFRELLAEGLLVAPRS